MNRVAIAYYNKDDTVNYMIYNTDSSDVELYTRDELLMELSESPDFIVNVKLSDGNLLNHLTSVLKIIPSSTGIFDIVKSNKTVYGDIVTTVVVKGIRCDNVDSAKSVWCDKIINDSNSFEMYNEVIYNVHYDSSSVIYSVSIMIYQCFGMGYTSLNGLNALGTSMDNSSILKFNLFGTNDDPNINEYLKMKKERNIELLDRQSPDFKYYMIDGKIYLYDIAFDFSKLKDDSCKIIKIPKVFDYITHHASFTLIEFITKYGFTFVMSEKLSDSVKFNLCFVVSKGKYMDTYYSKLAFDNITVI